MKMKQKVSGKYLVTLLRSAAATDFRRDGFRTNLPISSFSASLNTIKINLFLYRTRQYDDDDDDFTTCNWMEYVLVVILSCSLLLAALVLVVFWTLYSGQGYGWHEDNPPNPDKQFNLHPTLMVAGFVTISGFCKLRILA